MSFEDGSGAAWGVFALVTLMDIVVALVVLLVLVGVEALTCVVAAVVRLDYRYTLVLWCEFVMIFSRRRYQKLASCHTAKTITTTDSALMRSIKCMLITSDATFSTLRTLVKNSHSRMILITRAADHHYQINLFIYSNQN